MERKYTEEDIKELIQWGEERLSKKDYPKGTFKLSKSHKIPNCEKYIDAMVNTIKYNWKNIYFTPLIDEFIEFRKMVEELAQE